MPSRQADAVSIGSADDDDVQLPTVDQKYLSDKKFADFNISPNSKRCVLFRHVLGAWPDDG